MFYKWMIHLTNTPQPEHLKRAYPDRHVDNPHAIADVRATAIKRLDRMFDQIEHDLGAGPYLLGDHYTAADMFLLMMVMWTKGMPRPASSLPNLSAHSTRVLARPAIRAALETEGLVAPFV